MNTELFTRQDLAHIVSQIGLDRIMDDTIDALSAALRHFDPVCHITPVRDGFNYQEPELG